LITKLEKVPGDPLAAAIVWKAADQDAWRAEARPENLLRSLVRRVTRKQTPSGRKLLLASLSADETDKKTRPKGCLGRGSFIG
jgi:hypothetical protein